MRIVIGRESGRRKRVWFAGRRDERWLNLELARSSMMRQWMRSMTISQSALCGEIIAWTWSDNFSSKGDGAGVLGVSWFAIVDERVLRGYPPRHMSRLVLLVRQ